MTTEYFEVDYMSWYEKISKRSIQDTYIKYTDQVENSIYNMLSFMFKKEEKGIMEFFRKCERSVIVVSF